YDADDASIRQLLNARRGVAKAAGPAADEAFTILYVIRTIGQPVLEDLPHGGARPDLLGRQTVHLSITPIADDQRLLGIEHGKALQHVVEGGIQLFLVQAQFLFALLQGSAVTRLALQRLLARAQVADGVNLKLPEVGSERLTGDLDCNRLSHRCLEQALPAAGY